MKTMTVIFYRRYGEWASTIPWARRQSAEDHANAYLRGPNKHHIDLVYFKEIEFPETPEELDTLP